MANQRPSSGGVKETGKEARQGPLGKPVLMVLVGGMLLAGLAWGAAEIFGESTDNKATISGQESPATGQNQPSDDAMPPSGDQPTTNAPADSDPTPQSGTGGNTQTNPPSNTGQ